MPAVIERTIVKTRILMLAVLAALLAFGTVPAVSAQESSAAEAARPSVVVLIDMSGSLSQADLDEEVRATRLLRTLSDIDVFVIGFASEGSKPAWEVFCQPDDDLKTCTEDVSLRTNEEGNDTDHAAALASAAFVMTKPGVSTGDPRIVFMMTDGRFDPEGNGVSDEDLERLDEALLRVEGARAEVWPLGFGDVDQKDLDQLALRGPNSCDEPTGVIVDEPTQVLGALADALGNATCAPKSDDGMIEVPDGTDNLTFWYFEPDLPEGEIVITPESGEDQTFACELDELTDIWTCHVSTEDVGTGTWLIDPAPEIRPFVHPSEPSPSPTTTTIAPSTSIPGETTVPDTSLPKDAVTPTPEADDSGTFPWWVVLLAAAAVAGLAALLYFMTLPKLPRGYVSVRKHGGDWSPEETVRSERNQTFDIDVDGQYPSIMRTTASAPDVVLEATRKGTYLSGTMVQARPLVRLGEEIELDEGVILKYVTTLEDDFDDDDGYDDSFL